MAKIDYPKTQSQSLKDLRASITSRIALLLSDKPTFSNLIVIFMFLVYHIEILIVIFKPSAVSIKLQGMTSSQIFNNIYDTLLYQESGAITESSNNLILALAGILIYLLLDISIVLYIVAVLYKRQMVHATVEKICNSLAFIHNLLLFCPIHIFCCRVLYLLSKGEGIISFSESAVLAAKGLSIAIVVINAAWVLIKILLFTINIKTKDPLSAKTNTIALLDFIFRITVPIFEAFYLPDGAFIYGFLAVNLVYSLLRDYSFFYFLHYYRLETLKIATISHAVMTSLAFAALISRPISHSRDYPELEFLLPLWILCIIVFVKLYTRYLSSLTRKILQHPITITNPYHIIHFSRIYKSFAKCFQPGVQSDAIKEEYFIYTSIIKQSKVAHFLPEKDDVKLGHKTQGLIDKHFFEYSINLLKTAIKKDPKLLILQTTLAQYYTKHENLYMLSNQALDGHLSYSFTLKNSCFFIKMLILRQLRNIDKDQNDEKDILNAQTLEKYVHLQERYEKMKGDIRDQLKTGIQFWKQFQSSDADYLSLVNLANKASKLSKRIKKSIGDYKAFKEINFADPLLVCSLFYFFGENDLASAQKLFKEYSQFKFRAVQGSALVDFTSSESLYFVLSTAKDQFGTILDCSGHVDKVFGVRKELCLKRQLGIIMPQVYTKWFEDLLLNSLTNPNSEMLNSKLEIPILNKEGYIVSYCLRMILIYTSKFGLCFYGFMSPVNINKRRALIMENGQILNISMELSEDLDMSIKLVRDRKTMSIYSFCPSLEEIIKAFKNEINEKAIYNKNKDNTTDDEALEEDTTNSCMKEFHLVFSSNPDRGLNHYINPYTEEARKVIEYTAKIRMRLTQGVHFFELVMEKINDKKDQMLATKGSMTPTPTIYKFNMLKTVQTEQKTQPGSPSKIYTSSHILQKRESSPKAKGTGEQLASKNNLHYTETGSENAASPLILMSALSETRKLISSAKGDTVHDIYFNSEESPKEFKSMSMSLSFGIERQSNHSHRELNVLHVSDGDSNVLSSGLKRADAYKQIQKTTGSRSYQRSAHTYNLWFILTLLVQMTFLIWLNVYTSTVSENVNTLSQVVQSSYFRSYWTKIANQDLLYITAVRGDWYDFPMYILTDAFTYDLEQTNQYNQDLMYYLSFLDADLQQPFYEKQVNITQRDSQNNAQLASIDDTFEATSKIISYGLTIINETDSIVPGPYVLDIPTEFVVDNSLGGLFAVSDNLTYFVQNKLFSTFTDAKGIMKGALFASVAILILFILASLRFVSTLNKQSRNFIDIVSTIASDEIVKNENYMSTLIELLEKDANDMEMLNTLNGATSRSPRRATYVKNIPQDGRKTSKTLPKASMKKFNARNYLIFVGLFICLGLLVAFTVVYYSLASDKIITMERQHTSLNSALNFLSIFAYINSQLEIIALTNGTNLIENMSAVTFLQETGDKLSQISQFQDTLKDANGNTPAYQQVILFNFNCADTYTSLYSISPAVLLSECLAISDGLDYTGLLKVIIQLEQYIEEFILDFQTMERNITNLQDLYGSVFFASNYVDTGVVLLLHSYTYSVQTFANLVLELENERVALAWIAVILSLILGVITWVLIVKRLIRKEFERKKILALIPERLIFGNYLLMKYITQSK